MSVEEKLQLLEAVWANLNLVPAELKSPGWHEEALEETERRNAGRPGHLLRLAEGEGVDPRSPL
jgi:hypothetical protein